VILVIGGRSKIGQALVEALRTRGEEVRVLVRAQEAEAAFPAGLEAVVGDLSDTSSLRAAMCRAAAASRLAPHFCPARPS